MALRDRENTLIKKEVDLNLIGEKKIRIIRESIEEERKKLKQKEVDVKKRIRIKINSKDIEDLQSKLYDLVNKLRKDQE
jgi:hypothetical protein